VALLSDSEVTTVVEVENWMMTVEMIITLVMTEIWLLRS